VLLMDQNRSRWDQLQIGRGMRALASARQLGGGGCFYTLQAAIVACHARASEPEDTDWSGIAGLYAQLSALVASPVIELNRAVAVGMAEGPAAALAIVDRIAEEPALQTYHLLASVRGDLLFKLGRYTEARAALEAAAELAGNTREQELLRRRAAEAADAASQVILKF
jgi:predicted RNA polymerase sigma factor